MLPSGSFQTFGSFRPDRAARTPWSFRSRLSEQGDSRSDPSAQDAYTDDGSYETAAGNLHGVILLQDSLRSKRLLGELESVSE
jgi:hypothetical protein